MVRTKWSDALGTIILTPRTTKSYSSLKSELRKDIMKGLVIQYNSVMELHEGKVFCEAGCGDSWGTQRNLLVVETM